MTEPALRQIKPLSFLSVCAVILSLGACAGPRDAHMIGSEHPLAGIRPVNPAVRVEMTDDGFRADLPSGHTAPILTAAIVTDTAGTKSLFFLRIELDRVCVVLSRKNLTGPISNEDCHRTVPWEGPLVFPASDAAAGQDRPVSTFPASADLLKTAQSKTDLFAARSSSRQVTPIPGDPASAESCGNETGQFGDIK